MASGSASANRCASTVSSSSTVAGCVAGCVAVAVRRPRRARRRGRSPLSELLSTAKIDASTAHYPLHGCCVFQKHGTDSCGLVAILLRSRPLHVHLVAVTCVIELYGAPGRVVHICGPLFVAVNAGERRRVRSCTCCVQLRPLSSAFPPTSGRDCTRRHPSRAVAPMSGGSAHVDFWGCRSCLTSVESLVMIGLSDSADVR
jgi:hypothetical protein